MSLQMENDIISISNLMKHEVPIRVKVLRPLAGVAMKVQRGKDELLSPTDATAEELVFDFEMTADISGLIPNFLGKYAQGSKDARFIYVNSGRYAGQFGTCWDRRAKISLMNITRDQIDRILKDNNLLMQTEFEGTGCDGGPTCASVKGIEWKVVKR